MDRITGTTKLTGLLGRPVSHSISPLMHNAAFEACGLDYAYLCFDAGEKELPQVVKGLVALGARGWNCTMPDKLRMATLCDGLSLAAAATGSVNTVINENGVLYGHNTDGTGYMMSLKDAGFDVKGKRMTLLGAGGAAMSILAQAAIDGLEEISLFNRAGSSLEHAHLVAELLTRNTECRINICDIKDKALLYDTIQASDILTNATNVGMEPDADGCLIPDSSWFQESLIVSDIIYHPRETKLLKLAKEAGCPVCNGMYMLLYQGAEAFRLWTGVEMPVQMIKERYFL